MPNNDTLSPEITEFLLSARAHEALSSLSATDLAPSNSLSTLVSLRRLFTADQAGALLSQARLRKRAETKFPSASTMFFTSEALEQATAWPVALHRAEQINRYAPPGPVLDLGCGIGGDTLALAQFREVIAYDRDPSRLVFAEANAHAAGVSGHVTFQLADWTERLASNHLPDAAAAFVDPSRRVDGRRVFSLHKMQPSIDALLPLETLVQSVAVKIMPGVDDDEVPDGCGIEFVSHEGVCKEAVLWLGECSPNRRWASVHDGEGWHTLSASGETPPVGAISAGRRLYEPDPAVIRAGAFAELSAQLQAELVDPRIAYLVSDTLIKTPFASSFTVLEVHPFNLKLLNQRLRALQISSVELKKRGAPFEPESLRPRLKLSEQGIPGVVLFTRIGDDPIMIIAQRT